MPQRQVLDKTFVPISIIGFVGSAFIGGTFWLTMLYADVKELQKRDIKKSLRIEQLNKNVQEIKEIVIRIEEQVKRKEKEDGRTETRKGV